jgi:hypothetical protein
MGLFGKIWSGIKSFFSSEEEDEPELFDNEVLARQDSLAAIEEAESDTYIIEESEEEEEETIVTSSSSDFGDLGIAEPPEIEESDPELLAIEAGQEPVAEWDYESFPDWMSQDIIEKLKDEYGIFDYSDLLDSEKDLFTPGWQGYEAADEPATDAVPDEFEEMRDQIARDMHIPSELAGNLSDDELMTLITGAIEIDEMSRQFAMGDQKMIAEGLDGEFRGDFESWEDFLNSKLWRDFIIRDNHTQGWFVYSAYYDEDDVFHLEVYEVY